MGAGPSLASRVGVKKVLSRRCPLSNHLEPNLSSTNPLSLAKQRVASTSSRIPPGNVNGEWTHDLHTTVNPPNALASRISNPSTKRTAKLASALQRVDASQANVLLNAPKGPSGKKRQPQQQQQKKSGGSPAPEISIRGLAGPFSVLAQNFAPGTSAADIESAMTPVGGEMLVCKVLKTQPIMLVEMVFHSREAGEKVIEKFNDQLVGFSFFFFHFTLGIVLLITIAML